MAETLAKTLPLPTPPPRVSNRLGLIAPGVGRPGAILVCRPDLRHLAEVRELWTGARRDAHRIVLGIVELEGVPGEFYRTTIASAQRGYDKMLMEIASGIASTLGAETLDFLGRTISPREWGPLPGMRRRGHQELRRLSRDRTLDADDLFVLIKTLREAFLDRVDKAPGPT